MLAAAIRRFPRKMWLHKGSAAQPSIHDTVWYLADNEVVEYVACRRLIAQPGLAEPEIDFAAWSRSLGYFYQDVKAAMQIIRVLRRVTYRLLTTLPEDAWANTADLPMHGRVSLGEWLQIRESHFPEHIHRMERIHSEWMKASARETAAQEPLQGGFGPQESARQAARRRATQRNAITTGVGLKIHEAG